MKKREVSEGSINKSSLSEQAFNLLRKKIIDLEISPGDKIDVNSIANELGISKAPIRDALKTLADRGLIKIEPRVGYYTVQLSPGNVEDIYDMRELFEVYAIQQSFDKIPKNLIERCMRKTRKIQENDLNKDETRKLFDETDEKLHQEIILGYANNSFLKDFTSRIHDLVSLTRHLNQRVPKALEEHEIILHKLLEQDKMGAKKALKRHLTRVREETMDVVNDV